MYFSCALIPFNSSMVRLKATAITAVTTSVIFQFQYGTIKSIWFCCEYYPV